MMRAFEDTEQAHVIRMRAELTADLCDQFRNQVTTALATGSRDVVLDMTTLDVVDSKGLEAILWLQELCVEKLGQLRLANCQEHVLKIMEITRLKSEFEIHSSVEAALESLP